MLGDEFEDALARGGELLLGGPAVGRAGGLAGLDLLAQPGDADLEELVEVVREDGQELDPLEQRIALVAGLEQDAGVELEPRQLAVEVREVDFGRAARRRGRGGDRRSGVARRGSIGGHRWAEDAPGSGSRTVEATRPARIARLRRPASRRSSAARPRR